METSDLLRYVAEVFDRIEVAYLVTGSVATTVYGEPRFTNDIDVVADIPPSKVDAFCDSFPPDDYYLSRDAVRQAVEQCFQFNVIQPSAGLKVDVIIPKREGFSQSELSRGVRLPVGDDVYAWFASPEDVIIKKLEYFQFGNSDKHLRDIRGVLSIRGNELDEAYLKRWIKELALEDAWQAVLDLKHE